MNAKQRKAIAQYENIIRKLEAWQWKYGDIFPDLVHSLNPIKSELIAITDKLEEHANKEGDT